LLPWPEAVGRQSIGASEASLYTKL
jgi:hypothetical protein